jgi:hypothetical protein
MRPLHNVRIFARTFDGIVRHAIRFGNRGEWHWVMDGDTALSRHGDPIIDIPEGVRLPQSEYEFLDTVKKYWSPRNER